MNTKYRLTYAIDGYQEDLTEQEVQMLVDPEDCVVIESLGVGDSYVDYGRDSWERIA